MDGELLVRLIAAAERTIAARAAELDALDAAVGDGDHGANLARGLAALAARGPELARRPPGEALRAAAEVLGAEAGGDGGRCYAALLRGMADAAPAAAGGLAGGAAMLEAGVAALKAEGGAGVGDKTMLDVLEPAARALAAGAAEGREPAAVGARVIAAAAHGLHRTSQQVARHGLAAGLGAASVNHLDPGALSSALLVGAVVAELERPSAV